MDENKLCNDAAYYWSVCMLRRLRDMGLITVLEYEKIRSTSARHYETEIYAS